MLRRYSGCFLLLFFAFLFAGALGLMCQHDGQGVNDCGNDIFMWYCSIREHDLVRRFVDLTFVNALGPSDAYMRW